MTNPKYMRRLFVYLTIYAPIWSIRFQTHTTTTAVELFATTIAAMSYNGEFASFWDDIATTEEADWSHILEVPLIQGQSTQSMDYDCEEVTEKVLVEVDATE